MTAFDNLSAQLRNFKRTGPSIGIASCPTANHKHGDRSRGLSLRAGDDRCLVFCHAGCSAGEIMAAVGGTLADLYDAPLTSTAYRPSHSRIPYRDLLELIDQEALVVGMIALQFREKRELTDEDWQRLATAAGRIGRARDHARA